MWNLQFLLFQKFNTKWLQKAYLHSNMTSFYFYIALILTDHYAWINDTFIPTKPHHLFNSLWKAYADTIKWAVPRQWIIQTRATDSTWSDVFTCYSIISMRTSSWYACHKRWPMASAHDIDSSFLLLRQVQKVYIVCSSPSLSLWLVDVNDKCTSQGPFFEDTVIMSNRQH